MVNESWPENGLEIWSAHRARALNLERAHSLATKSWPKNGLKSWTAFFHKNQTLSHKLGLGLGIRWMQSFYNPKQVDNVSGPEKNDEI